MGALGEVTDIKALAREVQKISRGHEFLDTAAGELVSYLYRKFDQSLVLTRLFATIPFRLLPEKNKQFVTELSKSVGVDELLNDNVLVMSLMGSQGQQAEWNDRRTSKGHIGIPLVSGDFIEAIPMMSRLLKQLGLNLDWLSKGDSLMVVKTIGSMSGAFYVKDAEREVDNKGRKIIAAQDFVKDHQIKTVFGIGGAYVGTTTVVTVIGFCSQELDSELPNTLMPLIDRFKVSTKSLVEKQCFFSN